MISGFKGKISGFLTSEKSAGNLKFLVFILIFLGNCTLDKKNAIQTAKNIPDFHSSQSYMRTGMHTNTRLRP